MTDEESFIAEHAWDGVLFMGSKSMDLKEFKVKIPTFPIGHTKIYFKDPTEWKGFIPLSGKEGETAPIDNKRILQNITLFIAGKKILPVMADIRSGTINRSFLDTLTGDLLGEIDFLKKKLNEKIERLKMYDQFLTEMHLQKTMIAYIMDKAKKGRDLAQAIAKPGPAPTTVEVTTGKTEEKK